MGGWAGRGGLLVDVVGDDMGVTCNVLMSKQTHFVDAR